MSVAISVEHLSKSYGELRAVDDLSFEVQQGDVFSLLGHNGAGKTTTVEILEGLRNPTSGSGTIFGVDATSVGYSKLLNDVGILPQDFEPFERLTPVEAVEYWGSLFDIGQSKQQIEELLKKVDLTHRKDVRAQHLSGGEKRKLGIAMAMVNKPRLLFLDEPTTGLDPKARRDLWGLIQGLKKNGTTIFLTTHYLDEAEVLSDQIVIMNKGKKVAEGSPREIIKRYGRKPVLTIVGIGEIGLEEVRRHNAEAFLQGNDVVVNGSNANDIQNMMSLLAKAGVKVDDVFIKRDTLEDVFLSLIETNKQKVAE